MMEASPQALARVRAQLWAFRQSCVGCAAVEVGLVEHLAAGPQPELDLAATLQLSPGPLRRFVRALVALGLVERAGGRVALTDEGRALHALAPFARLIGAEYQPAWGRLAHSLRTGDTAFAEVFGMPVWQHREQNPVLNEALNQTMLAYQQSQLGAILDVCDFTASRLLVDVGGSYGRLCIAILERHPQLQAVLFDQPHVVPGMREQLAAAGLLARCTPRGGSFFDEVPEGGDTYLLKHILHNWDDTHCLRILRRCRQAMGSQGRLLIIENIMGEGGGWTTDGHWNDFALDLHMLSVLGGEVRSLEQFDGLFAASGFERVQTLDAGGLVDVIEARPREEAR